MTDTASLSALALNCTLKRGTEESSTQKLLDEVLEALASHDVESAGTVHVADLQIEAGVTSTRAMATTGPTCGGGSSTREILVLGTPIWLGHPSSYAQRVLERLDAFLGEEDDQGRMVSTDRVAIVAVVGNEDGAHHVASELYQGLADVGFTIPANGMTYWVGTAMQGVDYKDGIRSEKVDGATKLAAKNAAHLAGLLAAQGYPA